MGLLDSLKTELDSNLENVRCPDEVVSKKLVEVLLSGEYVRHSPHNKTDEDCHTYDPYVYIDKLPPTDICPDFLDPEHFEINKSHIYKHINTWYNNDNTAVIPQDKKDKKWKNNAKKNQWKWSDYFKRGSFGQSKIMTKYELGELIKRYVFDVENIVGEIAKRDRYDDSTPGLHEIGNNECKFIRKSTDGNKVTILDSENNSISQTDDGTGVAFSDSSSVNLITADGTSDIYINASNQSYRLVTEENKFQLESDYDTESADTIPRADCDAKKTTIGDNIVGFITYQCNTGPVTEEITALKTKYTEANTYYTRNSDVNQYFTDVQDNTRKLYTSYRNIVFNKVDSLPTGVDLSSIIQNYIFKFVKVADGNKDYKYDINGGKTLDACDAHGDTYQCINLSDNSVVATSSFTSFPVSEANDYTFDIEGNKLLTDIYKIRKNDYYEITDSQGTSHYFKVYNITKLDDNLADFSGFIDIANDTETITYDEFINTNIDIKLLDDAISGQDVNLYITIQEPDGSATYYYEMDDDSKENLLAFIQNYVNLYDTSTWDPVSEIDTWDKCENALSETIFALDQINPTPKNSASPPPCSNPYTECVCNQSTKGQEGISYGCKTTDIYKPYDHYEQINNLPVVSTQASPGQTLEYDWTSTLDSVGDSYNDKTYNTAYMSKGSDIINKGTNTEYDCLNSSDFRITSKYGLKWKKINTQPTSSPPDIIYTITQNSIDLINKYNTDLSITSFNWNDNTLDFTNYQSMLYFDGNGGPDIPLTNSGLGINKDDYLKIEASPGSYLYYKTNGTNNCDLSQDCYDSTNIISNDYTTKLCNLYNDEQICSSLPSLSTPLNNDFYSKYESCIASPASPAQSQDCVDIGYPGIHGDGYDNTYSFNRSQDCSVPPPDPASVPAPESPFS
jgi:hypothetical protein